MILRNVIYDTDHFPIGCVDATENSSLFFGNLDILHYHLHRRFSHWTQRQEIFTLPIYIQDGIQFIPGNGLNLQNVILSIDLDRTVVHKNNSIYTMDRTVSPDDRQIESDVIRRVLAIQVDSFHKEKIGEQT